MMKAFGDELKRARAARAMSLSDIADATLINVKYLEAIEQGNVEILPEAYVRAFIREYAASVGLDPADTMRRFDAARAPGPPAAPGAERPEARSAIPSRPAVTAAFRPTPLFTARNATIAGGAAIVVAVAILTWNLIAPEPSAPAREIPFQSVLQEHERQNAPAASPQAPLRAQPADSLTLTAAATDTVWFTVTADSLPPRAYYFRPGARGSWRARTAFTLTLGNGGALQFALNGKHIGALGKRGSVLRNVALNRQHLTGP